MFIYCDDDMLFKYSFAESWEIVNNHEKRWPLIRSIG